MRTQGNRNRTTGAQDRQGKRELRTTTTKEGNNKMIARSESSPKHNKPFISDLRAFYKLVALYTGNTLERVKKRARGVKWAYFPLEREQTEQDNHNQQARAKHRKILKLCDLYKNYALVVLNREKEGCVCHFQILTILSFLDRGGFYIYPEKIFLGVCVKNKNIV